VKPEAAFWDSSAFVPLCVLQDSSAFVRRQLRRYSAVAWWATSVEVHSAIYRLRRTQEITPQEQQWAAARLNVLKATWKEIAPGDNLRETAERLLEKHALKAGDSLQLAAALTWCGNRPVKRVFLCGDEKLSAAAREEGFAVVELP
jgi:predicted nucleic acid-binding protein